MNSNIMAMKIVNRNLFPIFEIFIRKFNLLVFHQNWISRSHAAIKTFYIFLIAPILRIHTKKYIQIVLLLVLRCNPKYLTREANLFIRSNFIIIVFCSATHSSPFKFVQRWKTFPSKERKSSFLNLPFLYYTIKIFVS